MQTTMPTVLANAFLMGPAVLEGVNSRAVLTSEEELSILATAVGCTVGHLDPTRMSEDVRPSMFDVARRLQRLSAGTPLHQKVGEVGMWRDSLAELWDKVDPRARHTAVRTVIDSGRAIFAHDAPVAFANMMRTRFNGKRALREAFAEQCSPHSVASVCDFLTIHSALAVHYGDDFADLVQVVEEALAVASLNETVTRIVDRFLLPFYMAPSTRYLHEQAEAAMLRAGLTLFGDFKERPLSTAQTPAGAW